MTVLFILPTKYLLYCTVDVRLYLLQIWPSFSPTRRQREGKLQSRSTRKKKRDKGVVIGGILVHRSYNTGRIHLETIMDITIALHIIDNTWAILLTFFPCLAGSREDEVDGSAIGCPSLIWCLIGLASTHCRSTRKAMCAGKYVRNWSSDILLHSYKMLHGNILSSRGHLWIWCGRVLTTEVQHKVTPAISGRYVSPFWPSS